MVRRAGPAVIRRPALWPRFTSTVRSTALTARLGRVLGLMFGVCFLTGLASHYQYHPWGWLPEPANPVWGYRVTQGLHVITGIACIPLVLVKLWSVYPNLFRWPPVRSVLHAVERLTVLVLVATSLVQLVTGFINVLNWYPFPWSFIGVHHYLGYVVIGSILLHVAIKLPDISYGLKTRLADGDVLTEVPWQDNPHSFSNAGQVRPPPTPAITRRDLLLAAGTGVGLVVVTTAGQVVTPLRPLALLAPRDTGKGPQGVPVNKAAERAGVVDLARSPDWSLEVVGPDGTFRLTLEQVERLPTEARSFPLTCVEGWSVGADWRGVPLRDVVRRAGGTLSSRVRVESFQPSGAFRASIVEGPQVAHALLATHVNGQRINLDHGYPLRLIAPNRAGVLNTKWLSRIEVA